MGRSSLLFISFTLILSFLTGSLYAQQVVFEEDFESYTDDNDFINNSPWTGDLNDFGLIIENDNTLFRIDNDEASGSNVRSQVRTGSTTAYGEWEFFIKVPSTTSSNRVYVYLVSDDDELDSVTTGPSEANGYAVHTGTGNFQLVRFDNGNDTEILSSDTEIIPDVGYQVKVTRNVNGEWNLFVSEGLGSIPEIDATPVTDNTYTESNFFGIYVRYSSGNNDNYFFDNIIISEETDELLAEDVEVISANQLEVTFSNNIEESSLSTGVFSVDLGVGNPQNVSLAESNVAELTFSVPFEDGDYTLTINDIEDEFGQTIEPNSELLFSVTNPFDVVDVDAITSARILVEFTEEPDQATLQNGNFEIREAGESAVINPNNIDYDPGEDPNTIFLELGSALPIGEYSLTINDLNSDEGWPLRDENVFDFEVVNPFFVEDFEPLSRTEFEIIFTQDVQIGGEDVNNYNLAGVGSPQTATLTENYVVLLEFTDPVNEGDQVLEISNLVSGEDWEIEAGTEVEFTLVNNFDLDDLIVSRGDEISLEFTAAPNEDDLAPANFEISGIGNPADVLYEESASSTTVTLVLGESLSTGSYTLFTTNLTSEFGWPLSTETDFDFDVVNPFDMTEFEIISTSEFLVTFSQDIDNFDVADFEITNFGTPENAELDGSDQIRITYADAIDEGERELVVNNVLSSEGWTLEPNTTIEFFLFENYEDGDLVISEFYYRVPIAWRTSEFDRPRYVEVYNRSDKLLNLRDFTLTGENISEDTNMPIGPGEYLVITRGVPVFEEQFGERNFVEADNFPSLSLTTSSSLVFETDEGELIEQLTYFASSWGGNEVSLERFSFDVSSEFRDNWAESEDVLSGSPGLPNTVTAPTNPPQAVAATFPEPQVLRVEFSRTLSDQSLDDLSNFNLDNNAVITSAEFTDNERIVEFELEDNLDDQFEYTLSYQNIDDIFGNDVSGTQQFNFTFENPFRILTAELVDDTNLRVQFTLPLQVSSVNLSDFQLSDGTDPIDFEFLNSETVRLTFSDSFDVGSFIIVVNDIISLENGWEIEENSEFEFFRFEEFEQGDVVINELMYRPPSGYSRYIEIQNTSDKLLNMRDWELRRAEGAGNNGGVISTVDLDLEPGEFIVISPDIGPLQSIFGDGPWFEMSNYPGLTQTVEDRVRLIDNEGNLVESFEYDPSTWGGNGVALERRRTDLSPEFIENWGESPNELLGTPGQPNEVEDFVLTAETVRALSVNEVFVEFNNDIQSGDAVPANFSVNGSNPSSVSLDTPFAVILEFSDGLSAGSRTLTINNVSTPGGFQIADDSQFNFTVFNQAQDGDIVINEFMYRPPDGYSKYIEIHNTSNRLLNLRDWELRRAGGSPSNGGVFSEEDLAIQPGGFIVITPDEEPLQEIFGSRPWYEMSNFPGFTLTVEDRIRLLNPEGELVQIIEYNPSTWGGNGVALERRSLDAPANDINNWGESLDELLGTPGLPNTLSPEDEGPQLVGADFISADSVRVEFTGSLDRDDISSGNFGINGGLSVSSIDFDGPTIVNLILNNDLSSGTSYTVTVSDISDIFGNVLQQASVNFTYYFVEQAEPGDVHITEFMYNEPDDYTRYIELYNSSNKAFDITGWQQANDTGTRRTLTNERKFFPPDTYLVILPNEELLNIFPDIDFVNAGGSLSALKNGGDEIVIVNNEGTTLDSLRYSPDWGGDGVALERRRINRSPLFSENWAESPNEMLGTPGRANEVDRNFDLIAERVQALSPTTLRVVFNADIRPGDASRGNFSVNGTNPVSTAMDTTFAVLLDFENQLETGPRTLTISNVRTLGGFQIEDNSQFEFTVFDQFEEGDIVINEFMYRPPTGYVRYVELFNSSSKLLNLRDWRLQRRQVSTESRRNITSDDLALHPGDYIVLTADADAMRDIFGERNYFEMVTFPNFTVTVDDQIRLFTDGDVLADSLQYSPSSWGGNEIALERISLNLPSDLQANWAESPNPLLGTPGLPNEVSPDSEPPAFESLDLLEDRGFVLTFNKSLDPGSATDEFNYQIDPSLSISMIMLDQHRVQLLVNDELVNDQVYDITISGISDLFGNEMEPTTRSVRYLEFGDVEPQQLVINEVLYRRLQAGSPEFVEIYNRSDENVDLSGWTLWDSSGSATIPSGTAIRENDYIVFTDTQSFAAESDKIVYLSDFQSLSNNGDAVVLKNTNETVIDSLFYRPTWGNNEQGVSLERKDPSAISIDPANWAPSTDERSSTPAEPNTRFEIDETAPEIVFVNLFHPDSLEVRFSEYVDLGSSDNAEVQQDIAAGPELHMRANSARESVQFTINGIEADVLKYDPGRANRVVLDGSGINIGEENTLTIENFTDFQGNVNTGQQQAVAQPISQGDLVINEIMFNPIADDRDGLSDQSDYVEIHNRRDYAISLEGIFLHDQPNDNDEITRIDPVSSEARWIPAGGYALFYPESDPFPFNQSRTAQFFDLDDEFAPFAFRANRTTLSLPNAGRQVFLADSTRSTIDMVDYDESWHNPNLVDTRGVALERINPDFDSNDPTNWGSNTTILGGSPGRENSIFQQPGQFTDDVGVTLDPNPFSPDGDGFEDNLFINYTLDEPDYLLRIRIYDRYGRLVRKLVDSEPAGFQGSVIWDGRTDNGQTNRIGIYIVFIEAFNSSSGSNLTFRETAVLARQF